MRDNESRFGWSFWAWWVAATAVGWVAGVLVAIVLSDLVVNLFYHRETNLIVGLCMGGSMAVVQVRAVRRWVRLGSGWVWGGAIMMAPPFIASVIFDELSLDTDALVVKVMLGGITVVGGLVGVLFQVRALRPHTARAHWWVAAMAVAWGLAIGASKITGFMGGGVVLGLVGGGCLVLLFRGPAVPEGA